VQVAIGLGVLGLVACGLPLAWQERADDQCVTSCPRANENIDVARVKQVEYTVGEYDTTALPRTPLGERGPRHHFSLRVERTQ